MSGSRRTGIGVQDQCTRAFRAASHLMQVTLVLHRNHQHCQGESRVGCGSMIDPGQAAVPG